MQLKPGTLLQGGKYKIIRTLGQGGFGITYEAEQVLLRRKVAVKEFFMKDCCERDNASSQVTVGTGIQRSLADKFRGKFVREAQMIAGMDHPNIVRVTDVFEENATAYYVMDYLPGGSLADKVKKNGSLSEEKAEEYIRQVSNALAYIHSLNTVHLDIKPSNILLNSKGEAVLIDFGVSKHYDDSGEQTSSTPVGISKGYAPLEQGRDGDVSQFGPSTDIYALGGTLYYLVTGIVPPEASIVNEDGLTRPLCLSDRLWGAIEQAMRPRRKDRPQTIVDFLSILNKSILPDSLFYDSDDTVLNPPSEKDEPKSNNRKKRDILISSNNTKSRKVPLFALLVGLILVGVIIGIFWGKKGESTNTNPSGSEDSVAIESATKVPSQAEIAPDPVKEVPGIIVFSSEPSGASIWLDGRNTGFKTPATLSNIAPGKHNYKLVLNGYHGVRGEVVAISGRHSHINRSLVIIENTDSQGEQESTSSRSTTPTSDQTRAPSSSSIDYPRVISGTVYAGNNHSLIVGAVVTVAETGESTRTNSSGYYLIQAKTGQTLVFTDNYFRTTRVRVNDNDTIDVTMSPNISTISGIVRAANNNSLIIGVVVSVAETGESTRTNSSGQYSIKAKSGQTLVFTNDYFNTLKVKVGNKQQIMDVRMMPKN